MNSFRHGLQNFSWDNWILLLCGVAALVLSLIAFIGINPLSLDQSVQVLIGAVGALMLAVVSLTSRRSTEIAEIKDAVRISDTELLDSRTIYPKEAVYRLSRTKYHVSDIFMNWSVPHAVGDGDVLYLNPQFPDQYEFNRKLFDLVSRREIDFRQIQVIYHKQGLAELIHRLLVHKGLPYYIRHFDPAPKSIPIMHVTSFDDEVFYLGVGYPEEPPPNNQVLRVREPNTNELVKAYWSKLWNDAIPLNEGGEIDQGELKRISRRLHITDSEFEAMYTDIEKQVEQYKRQLAKRR